MRQFLRNAGIVLLASIIFGLPMAMVAGPSGSSGSPIYDVLETLAGAIGAGIFPLFAGIVVLVAARKTPSRGLRGALVVAAVVSALLFLVVWQTV
jgi:phosphotransferase system  glucose/maltose/N-acetylglucosamine-specific IIC component